MGRPSKCTLQLVSENKSHRTKKELEVRKKGEESLLSTVKMKCRFIKKENPIAYKEFVRIAKLFENIEKNDALYEASINRYCLIYEESLEFEIKREQFYKSLVELESAADEMSLTEYLNLKAKLQQQVLNIDVQIMKKRAMLLAIEKENVMTVASALRSIPKKPSEEDDPDDELF